MAARMNISVPDKLKRKMDRTRADVNWSAIAAQAFEIKLGEIAARKEKKKMTDVIQRLRASKLKGQTDRSTAGEADGREWATHSAEALQLKRLQDYYDRAGDDAARGLSGEDTAHGPGEHLYFTIQPDDDGDRSLARDFWEIQDADAFEDKMGNADYVCGFAAGALDVWNEVRDQL